ncbi:nucleoside 2-deoxyribosyltransferase [Latilactobacillus sakei]|uniref:Nucleoside 2-deoxyribosyltransferase n=1 Tax=Latilactobacillus sakei TaxID=1599 RepID=A0AAE8J4A8_LATSK|nr:nucleoside 2-deoxyribosyltransferase [Latilactobacillus sakei]AST84029.1 nucleoside 2-deoxyribosyltransferase [Latilactobacillus sakei]AWZ41968.1 nucleoside 2-deoxyribosyltransferase [Latilactobacillus sakei]AYG17156.1 nucleoside 2-deoxyribosyltransferase [Latilactobacillus sakei]AYG25877.1 nucleoside 2-deoxyribosyltransferase [Latilactobacillus sakei]AYG29742.1 nucleoside 2-deoxyribosyltransferase [Latilactobacillus sakei]
MKIYFANALFSQADFDYNTRVVAALRQAMPTLDIYLPQENAAINDKEAYANSEMIAQADTEQLVASDLVIAVLDGPTIDVGVASEIGVAYARNIPIIGLYTDSRQQGATNSQKVAALQTIAENQFHYLNLYTVGLIKLNGTIVNSVDALIETVQKY